MKFLWINYPDYVSGSGVEISGASAYAMTEYSGTNSFTLSFVLFLIYSFTIVINLYFLLNVFPIFKPYKV